MKVEAVEKMNLAGDESSSITARQLEMERNKYHSKVLEFFFQILKYKTN